MNESYDKYEVYLSGLISEEAKPMSVRILQDNKRILEQNKEVCESCLINL